MISFRENARIIGWPLFIGAIPVFILNAIRKEDRMDFENYEPPAPTSEWESDAYCPTCDHDTIQLYVEWQDPGHVVTRECLLCGDVVEVEDV